MDVIDVFKKLYQNGVMDRFAKLHAKYWPSTHKANEGAIWHRWFLNELEKEMRKINPSISMPYWVLWKNYSNKPKLIFLLLQLLRNQFIID